MGLSAAGKVLAKIRSISTAASLTAATKHVSAKVNTVSADFEMIAPHALMKSTKAAKCAQYAMQRAIEDMKHLATQKRSERETVEQIHAAQALAAKLEREHPPDNSNRGMGRDLTAEGHRHIASISQLSRLVGMVVRVDLRHGFGMCSRFASIPKDFLDGMSKMLFGAGSYQPAYEAAKAVRDGVANFIKCAAGVTIKALIDSSSEAVLKYGIFLIDFVPAMPVWLEDAVTGEAKQTDPYKLTSNVAQETPDTWVLQTVFSMEYMYDQRRATMTPHDT